MELRHLRYFVAVAEAENVTRAAARLRIAQPAVSRQIRDLEEELGVPLLERQAKSVRLTEAGRLFLEEARAVLQRADAAVDTVRRAARRARGELQVGYAPSLTARILPQALRRMQADFPEVRVFLHDLTSEEMFAQLQQGRLHLALTAKPGKARLQGFRFHELARYPIRLATVPAHPLSRERVVELATLGAQPIVGYSRAGYPEYHHWLARFVPGFDPARVEEHDSVTGLIAAVEAGRGVALLPDCVACLAGSRLALAALHPEPPPIVVGAVRRVAGEVPFADEFIRAAASSVES